MQKYTHLAILDFEASVVQTNDTTSHEITEFPVILVSTTAQTITAEFHTFIQPTRNPGFRNKKGIPQSVFDKAPKFPQAWADLVSFLETHKITADNTLAVTCGDWDLRAMLPTELKYHGLIDSDCDPAAAAALQLFSKWCNIKHAFATHTGKRKVDSMVRMLNIMNEKLVGTHHSGIDDSRNIVTIAKWLLRDGHLFRVTSLEQKRQEGGVEDGVEDGEEEKEEEEQAKAYERERALLIQEEKRRVKEVADAARVEKLMAGAVPPQEMFRDTLLFSVWDSDGVPTHLADGTEMTRSAVNKHKKLWKARDALHQKYLAWKEGAV
ncbi:ribonuclease H-like domain-containing protein [Obelidium mucronatum]|nr:ribonuclease H-like domain-containing protein [Obelidium mucronatum]